MNLFDKYLFKGKTTELFDGNHGKWVKGSLVVTENESFIIGKDTGKKYPVISETVGQCIAQYDKNAELIYEGDLVKAKGKVYTVARSAGKWVFQNNMSGACEDAFWFEASDIEILGSTHDERGKAISLKYDIDTFLKSYIAEPARGNEDSEGGEDVYMDMYRLLVRTQAYLEDWGMN